jgi:hypothetical protein
MDPTTPSYPRLQSRSPYRSPAWRWERAWDLVQAGRHFSRRRDDELTRRAMAYLRDLRRCREDRRVKRALTYPDVHAALRLHEQGGNTAVEVQARLLARQSFDEVARHTSVPVEAVKMYESLFFQVTDRLDARDWVTSQAVGWWEFNPATGRDPATVLRGFAYHGGPLLLDAALPYLLGDRLALQPGHDPTTAEGRLDRFLRLTVLLEMLPWGAQTDTKLFQMHAERLADARKAVSQRPIEPVVARNATKVLETIAAEAPQQGLGQRQLDRGESDQAGIRETA